MARTVGMILTKAGDSSVEGKLACPHCGKEYKSAAALRAHVEAKHPEMLDEAGPGGEQE